MSQSALRYQPAPNRNQELRDRILELAQRHRRYGSGVIFLKLRQEGLVVNHKRINRLYAEAALQVKRRKRKKIPVGSVSPCSDQNRLIRSGLWFLCLISGADCRVIKCLTIVDDATHEAIAVIPERAIGVELLPRIMDKLCRERG